MGTSDQLVCFTSNQISFRTQISPNITLLFEEISMSEPHMKFCRYNDLMYPKCVSNGQQLVFYCKYCGEEIAADPQEYCVLKVGYIQQRKEKINTAAITCTRCNASQAVFQAKQTVRGMKLQYQCLR